MRMWLIRRIRYDEGELWRETRMRMILESPNTYLDSPADLATRSHKLLAAYAAEAASGSKRCIYFAENNTGIIATASAVAEGVGITEMFGLWVDPKYRNSGVGTELIQVIEDWALNTNSDILQLTVNDSNLRAKQLYVRVGYQLDGRSKPSMVKPGTTALYMTKRLRDT
jgi:ribosomal protein S18 acetylase RimI-like enzyme